MRFKIPAILAATLMVSPIVAQTPPATSSVKVPAAKMSVAKPSKASVVRTAKSLDCSKQADAKGLHGKPRKGFMSSCKKA